MSKDKLLVLCSKSSCGKDSILKELTIHHGFNACISHTTRPIRNETEQDGVDYYFVTNEKFYEMESNGEFAETRCYNTYWNNESTIWHYGISRREIENKPNPVVILDLKGVNQLADVIGRGNMIVIYIDVMDSIRELRAKKRGNFSQKEWTRRFKDDNIVFSEDNVNKTVDHRVMNYDFDICIDRILELLSGE